MTSGPRQRNCRRPRGYTTLIVVLAMAVVAGSVAVVAHQLAARHIAAKSDRLHSAARFAAESTEQLIRLRSDSWLDTPAEPLELDLSAMLTPGQTGRAMVTFQDQDTECPIAIRVTVRAGRHSAVHHSCMSLDQ